MGLRKNFSELLKEFSVSIPNEYEKLHGLLYDKVLNSGSRNGVPYRYSFYDVCTDRFRKFPVKRTILSLDEFNKYYGFDYEFCGYSDDFDKLISFCEYAFNLIRYLVLDEYRTDGEFILNHIKTLISQLHYSIMKDEDGLFYFIPENSQLLSVCSVLPEDDGMLLLRYTHHSTKTDINYKKRVLSRVYEILEPYRGNLNSKLVDIFFSYSNSCNVRHNNVDEGPKHKEFFSNMTESQVIELYDNLFRIGLILLMEKENLEMINLLKSNKEMAQK